MRGVETAKIAGLALLALLAAERWAIGAPASAEKVRWPSLDAVAVSDFEEARELIEKRKWAEAAIILKSVLRKDPDYSPAAILLAEALFHSNRREEGLSALSQAASRERGARRAAILRRLGVLSRSFLTAASFQEYQDGLNLLLARKYKAARERFERVLRGEPANVEVLVRVGECFVMERDWDSAAETLKLARKLDPFQPETRLWLGRAMHQRGELAEALEELKAARAELPGSELAPIWLSEALVATGRREEAITVLEADLARQPLHGHVVSFYRSLTPTRTAEEPGRWFELLDQGYLFHSWKIEKTGIDSRHLSGFPTNAGGLSFYADPAKKLPRSTIPALYAWLKTTDFVSLQASTSPDDDFAEGFAQYVHTQVMGRPYEVSVGERRFRSCFEEPRCARKKEWFEKTFPSLRQVVRSLATDKPEIKPRR